MRKFITSEERLSATLEKMDYGKFLFLYLLAQNVDFFTFKRILDQALLQQRRRSRIRDDDDTGELAIRKDRYRYVKKVGG